MDGKMVKSIEGNIDYLNCPIGRDVEITVAKMNEKLSNIEHTNTEQNKTLKDILYKIECFDDRYVSKPMFKLVVSIIVSLITIIATILVR